MKFLPFLGTLHKPLNLTEELASYLKSTVEKDDEVKEKETKKKKKKKKKTKKKTKRIFTMGDCEIWTKWEERGLCLWLTE